MLTATNLFDVRGRNHGALEYPFGLDGSDWDECDRLIYDRWDLERDIRSALDCVIAPEGQDLSDTLFGNPNDDRWDDACVELIDSLVIEIANVLEEDGGAIVRFAVDTNYHKAGEVLERIWVTAPRQK